MSEIDVTITPDWNRRGGWKLLHIEMDWNMQSSDAARTTARHMRQATELLETLASENEGIQ